MGYQHRPSKKFSIQKTQYLLYILLTLILIFLILLIIKPKLTGKVYERQDVNINQLNLDNFPNIFIENKEFKATVVYDLAALPAVIKLENYLFEKSRECTSIFSSEKSEDIPITTKLYTEFGSKLDSGQLQGFKEFKTNIDINGVSNTYSAHEEIQFADDNNLAPHTTLTFNSNDRFKERVILPLPENSVGFYYVFDSELQSNNRITDASLTEPITIEFLNKELRIDSATSSSITINVGDKFQLNAGDSVFIEGKELTLINTESSKAKIMVDGLIDVINENSAQRINGLEVVVEDISAETGIGLDSATFYAGKQAKQTFKDGDPFIGEDKDNPLWEWDLENLNQKNPTIGITLAEEVDSPDETNPYIQHPLYEGDSLCLPYDYACIHFKELQGDNYQNYEITTTMKELYASVEDSNNGNVEVSSAKLISFQTNRNGFNVNGEDTTEIFFYYDGTKIKLYRKLQGSSKAVYFADASSNAFQISYKDTNINVDVNWNTNSGDITLDLDQDLVIYFEINNNELTYLGHSDGASTTTNDIKFGSLDISSYNENLRLKEGIIIEDPESHLKSDKIILRIPQDINDFKAIISIQTQTIENNDCTIETVNIVRSRMYTDDKNQILIGTDSLADRYLSNKLLNLYNNNHGIIALLEKDGTKILLILGHTPSDLYSGINTLLNKEQELNGEVIIF